MTDSIYSDYYLIHDALSCPKEAREQMLIDIAEQRDLKRGRGVVFVPMREIDKANMLEQWDMRNDSGGTVQ